MPKGTPQRIDKAYSWDAPLAAHGMMHMVITNAAKKDPYGIDVLFMYMANMSWNSAMNVPDTIKYLTQKEPDGDYTIPKIIYSDAYASEMVHYADLILPDTTYLERWDCISMLDRPISEADGPADSIRQPVVEPDRDVRPFQTGAARSRRPAGPSRHDPHRWHARAIPAAMPTISSTTSARPASARWPDSVGPTARPGQGRAEPRAAAALYRQRLPLVLRAARPHEILPPCELGLSRLGDVLRLHGQARAGHPPALLRAAAEVPPGGAGPRQGCSATSSTARASCRVSIPFPSGIRPSRARWCRKRTSRCMP